MALSPATLDAPLLTQNQQSPKTTQVVGRIQRVVNGVIHQFEGKASAGGAQSIQAKVNPRDGFTPMTTGTYSPLTGAAGAVLPGEASLIVENASGGLVGIFADQPGTFSSGANAWEIDQRSLVPAVTLSTLVRYTANTKAQEPDSAAIGNTVFSCWVDAVDGVTYTLQDTAGSIVLTPTLLGTGTAGICKCVADGTRFWLFAGGAAGYTVTAIDVHGAILGSASDSFATSGDRWDIPPNIANIGVMLARPSGAGGITTSVFTWSGSAVVQTNHTDNTALCGNNICQWLTNTSGLNGYLATVDSNTVHAWRIQPSGAQNHQYNLDAGVSTSNMLNLTGAFIPDGSNDVIVAYTIVSTTDDRQNVTHVSRGHFSGAGVQITLVQPSLSIACRAFTLGDSHWYVIGYYPSGAANGNGQPGWYLVNLNVAAATGVLTPVSVVGRFDYLLAWAPWNTTSSTYQRFQLSTPYGAADATLRIALSYRSESFTSTVAKPLFFRYGAGTVNLTSYVSSPANTVGIKEYVFELAAGEAFTFGGETLIPGALACLNSGPTFSESNVNQAPEPPTLVTHTTGGGLTDSSTYQFVVVFEGTNNDGSIWRSLPSPAVNATTGASGSNICSITLTGLTCFVSQRAKINVSIYQTSFILGVATTNHYKITSDLTPTLNNTGAATWTFTAMAADAVTVNNEILYTDQGFLDRYPAPAFSMGVDWQLREWVIGWDGAIWFSGLKSEGDALWFNPLFRVVLPANEKPVTIAQLDSFMVIGTATSWWQIPAGNLPDDTGQNGNIPTPTRLPFANGCLGHSKTNRDGVHYDSSAGGAWLITRDLRNVNIGAQAQDDFATGEILGIAINQDQRVGYLLGSLMAVWDSEASAWTTWELPHAAPILSTYKGQFVFTEASTPAVWRQIPGSSDDNGVGIPLTLRVAQCDVGGVRNFKRVWATQFFGEYLGDHDLAIDVFYDDDTDTVVSSYFYTPDPAPTYLYEIAMARELCSNVGFEFRTSFPRGPSGGAAFESLAFYVGLEKGLNKLPIARRIAPAGGAPVGSPLFWFKADAGVTMNGSNQVSRWNDQTPNRFDMLPQDSGGTLQGTSVWPVLTPNVANGLPAMLYNGTGTLMQHVFPNGTLNQPSPDSAPITVLAVAKPIGAGGATGGVICTLRMNNFDMEFGMRLIPRFSCQCPASSAQDSHHTEMGTIVDYTNKLTMFDWRYLGQLAAEPKCAVRINGAAAPVKVIPPDFDHGLTGYTGASGFSIGYCNAVFAEVWPGYIMEVIGYLGTDDAIAAATSLYLKNKWGL